MRDQHATEHQIQKYVDERHRLERPVINHIESCDYCSEEAVRYRLLFDGLADDSDIVLPADFASSVTATVTGAETTVPGRWSVKLILSLAAPILIVAVTLYFLGFESILAGFSRSVTVVFTLLFGELFSAACRFLARYGLDAELSGFTALLLLAVGLIDRLLRPLLGGKAMLSI